MTRERSPKRAITWATGGALLLPLVLSLVQAHIEPLPPHPLPALGREDFDGPLDASAVRFLGHSEGDVLPETGPHGGPTLLELEDARAEGAGFALRTVDVDVLSFYGSAPEGDAVVVLILDGEEAVRHTLGRDPVALSYLLGAGEMEPEWLVEPVEAEAETPVAAVFEVMGVLNLLTPVIRTVTQQVPLVCDLDFEIVFRVLHLVDLLTENSRVTINGEPAPAVVVSQEPGDGQTTWTQFAVEPGILAQNVPEIRVRVEVVDKYGLAAAVHDWIVSLLRPEPELTMGLAWYRSADGYVYDHRPTYSVTLLACPEDAVEELAILLDGVGQGLPLPPGVPTMGTIGGVFTSVMRYSLSAQWPTDLAYNSQHEGAGLVEYADGRFRMERQVFREGLDRATLEVPAALPGVPRGFLASTTVSGPQELALPSTVTKDHEAVVSLPALRALPYAAVLVPGRGDMMTAHTALEGVWTFPDGDIPLVFDFSYAPHQVKASNLQEVGQRRCEPYGAGYQDDYEASFQWQSKLDIRPGPKLGTGLEPLPRFGQVLAAAFCMGAGQA